MDTIKDYRNIDARDRRIVIIASPTGKAKLNMQIDKDVLSKTAWPFLVSGTLKPLTILYPLAPMAIPIAGPLLVMAMWATSKILTKKPISMPYPIFDLNKSRDYFQFPMNHPVDRQIYACCDAEPNLYVPLASFHDYMYQAKLSAFHKLCANLLAKRCLVNSVEEDNIDITSKIGTTGIPSSFGPISAGINGGYKSNKNTSAKIFAEYPKKNKKPIITETKWMNGEPTWLNMQKLRMENRLKKMQADFCYTDDMGINASVAAKVSSIGIDIGGEYQKMKKRKLSFEIEFWPFK